MLKCSEINSMEFLINNDQLLLFTLIQYYKLEVAGYSTHSDVVIQLHRKHTPPPQKYLIPTKTSPQKSSGMSKMELDNAMRKAVLMLMCGSRRE
jgi:hypothetical protein